MELSMYTAVRIVKMKACRKLTRISKPVIATSSANENGMITTRALSFAMLIAALVSGAAAPAMAQSCTRQGVDVSCNDGRRGVFAGDAIIWADGTRSNLASPHPSVIIGNKSSVVVGPGVFVGKGNGVVPMENPSDPRRARCPVLDGVSYCY